MTTAALCRVMRGRACMTCATICQRMAECCFEPCCETVAGTTLPNKFTSAMINRRLMAGFAVRRRGVIQQKISPATTCMASAAIAFIMVVLWFIFRVTGHAIR